MIKYQCSNCGQKFKADDKFAGKKGKCHKCGDIVVIPKSNNETNNNSSSRQIVNANTTESIVKKTPNKIPEPEAQVSPHCPSDIPKNSLKCSNGSPDKPSLKPREDQVKCPNPECRSTQITANKKGFRLGKAAVGGVLLGPVGLLGGVIGSNKILLTCLRCGHQWKLQPKREDLF